MTPPAVPARPRQALVFPRAACEPLAPELRMAFGGRLAVELLKAHPPLAPALCLGAAPAPADLTSVD